MMMSKQPGNRTTHGKKHNLLHIVELSIMQQQSTKNDTSTSTDTFVIGVGLSTSQIHMRDGRDSASFYFLFSFRLLVFSFCFDHIWKRCRTTKALQPISAFIWIRCRTTKALQPISAFIWIRCRTTKALQFFNFASFLFSYTIIVSRTLDLVIRTDTLKFV